MGAVYRARHAFTGANVALKIMHSGVARSKNARERFLREAQAPTSIGHPGIVKVSDAGVAEDGTLYLVLELLEGEDLGAAVERGAVDGAALIDIGIELLDTLSAAHATGLVHRDIKPENIFLCRPSGAGPRVRLLDFGITRQVSDTDEKLTQTGTILGTPHYMSPEQARGQPVDARSDVYSVGGTLFYALTGRPPFTAENYNLLIVAIMTHPAPSVRAVRPEIPPDLAAVVDRALSADVSSRFPSALEMRAALEACARPDLPAIRPPSVEMGFEPTMASDASIPAVPPSTPVVHSMPAHVPAGATTQPNPAKTPPSVSSTGGQRGIPPTMGASAVVAQTPPVEQRKGSPTNLLVGLVVVLGALIGGGVAAFLLIPGARQNDQPDAATATPPPAVVTTSGPPAVDAAADAHSEVQDLEAQIAELRAENEAREKARQEEEAARAAAQRRAAMRRAEQRAAEEAMRRTEAQMCRIRCSQEQAACNRRTGGMGAEGMQCFQDWNRCLRDCNR